MATWWPVMLETVPGSGERLAVAAVVRAASGQSQARQLISPAGLSNMFGLAGSGMRMVVGKTTLSLQAQLSAGVSVEQLAWPFGGTALGEARDCVASDINEVFEVAFRLGGAFGASQFGSADKPSVETHMAFDEWGEKVRLGLLNSGEEQLREAFNVRVTLLARKKGRIGFVHGAYAANFGVLRPGRPASSDVRALKVKIFDLEALKHRSPLFGMRTEVLVGFPEFGVESAFSSRELETQRESWVYIEDEANRRDVQIHRYGAARGAVEHLKRITAK